MKQDIKEKILKFLLNRGLTPGNILLVCLSFWLTVILVRVVIFWSVINGTIPALFLKGYHIHHFVTGFVLLIIAAILFSRKKFSKYTPLALFGCSVGLIADEFLFWTSGHFDYWSLVNLAAILAIGTAMAVTYIYAKRWDLAEKYRLEKLHLPKGPRLLAALLPIIIVTIILYVMFSYNGLDPYRPGYLQPEPFSARYNK